MNMTDSDFEAKKGLTLVKCDDDAEVEAKRLCEAVEAVPLGSAPESVLGMFVEGKSYVIEGTVPEEGTQIPVHFWFTGKCTHAGVLAMTFISSHWSNSHVRQVGAHWCFVRSPDGSIHVCGDSIEFRGWCRGECTVGNEVDAPCKERRLWYSHRFAFEEVRRVVRPIAMGVEFRSRTNQDARVFICEVNWPNEANGKSSCSEKCVIS